MCSNPFFYSQKNVVAVEKGKVTTTKEQRTAQAGCKTTRTERCTQRKSHFAAARNPTVCTYVSTLRRMRLTHSSVVSKANVKTIYGNNINESTTAAWNITPKREKCKQTIRQTKKVKKAFFVVRE